MQSEGIRKKLALKESRKVQQGLLRVLPCPGTYRSAPFSLAMNFKDMCGMSLPGDALLSLKV